MKKTVAKALIMNPKGQYLFLQRGLSHPNFPGHLDLPGGEVETGELIHDSIIREIEEEIGINLKDKTVKDLFRIEKPEVVHVLVEIKANINNEKISLSWEHSNYEWIFPDDIIKRGIDDSMDSYYLDVFSYLIK